MNESALVEAARSRLEAIDFEMLAEAGFRRDRSRYFLNIAYPSMQAMRPVDAPTIYPPEQPDPTAERAVALYVHVPFCTSNCSYCHYYKEFDKPEYKVDQFIDAVGAELAMHRRSLGRISVRSMYFGGGTPSYMTPSQIDRIFTVIGEQVDVVPGAEVSFEVHPESSDDNRLERLIGNGVNRLNIGIESFDDTLLRSENRRHTRAQALGALARARTMGLDNINIDLIYGLRGQTVPMWEDTLRTIGDIAPASATLYYLRLKAKTTEYNRFIRHPEQFPSEQELLLMHAMSFEHLENQLGYTQRPVDWFTRDSKYFHVYQDHNWRRSDETELLGLGPSAYSYINGWQYYNVNHTDTYIDDINQGRLPVWRGEKLEGIERLRRTVMLGIKIGMDRPAFARTYGVDAVDAFPAEWQTLSDLGLVSVRPNSIELTYAGKLLADEVGQAFYSATMKQRMEQVEPHLISTTWPVINK